MDGAERFEFIFGADVDREAWESAGPDERRALIETRFGDGDEPRFSLRSVVVDQLVSGRPPEVWETAHRLAKDGFSVDRVLNQLTMVFARSAVEGVEAGKPDAYLSRLDRLPLPSSTAIEHTVLDIAAAAAVLPTGELVAAAIRSLGEEADDPLIVNMVELVAEELALEPGPLAWLTGDRTAHVATLCDGVVLTHILSESEQATSVLSLEFDLAAFDRHEELSFEGDAIEPVSEESGQVEWIGPEGWLDRFDVDTVLAVRVDRAGAIDLQPLSEAPPVAPGLVAAVRRAYDEVVKESGLPVTGEELILQWLAEDRAAFAAPRAPLSVLCEAADLERRESAVAHDADLWVNDWLLGRYRRVMVRAGDEDLAMLVLQILELTEELGRDPDSEAFDADQIRQALDGMADLEVLDLVINELFDDLQPLGEVQAAASRLLDAAARPPQRAIARLVAAMAAEAAGDWMAAEQHLELAVEADPTNEPATDRLAWYAGDRGDAARASRLWRRCARSETVAHDLATIEPFIRPAAPVLGRNDPCWCGSGRKYKQCHLGVATPISLPDRVGWLCRKAVGYLERVGPAARAAIVDVVYARVDDADGIGAAMEDPLVMDLVLTEGGWFGRFLADRGHLLPDDEALLAASWATVERTVYEITAVVSGVGLTIRDLRTGDEHDVRERTFSTTARVGLMICARAVPDGETHQLIGAVIPVAPGTETAVLELLDAGDPYVIAAWARDLERPAQVRTSEGEPLVECEIAVRTTDVDALLRHLDAAYDNDIVGEWWSENHDLTADESVIRARFHFDDGRLIVTTNSNERADRILARLRDAVPVTVISDSRTPLDIDSLRQSKRSGLPDLGNLQTDAAPDLDGSVVADLQEQMEQRWCNEPVPALGDLTPREAAVDPTRREQLERLLASFDAISTPPGAFTMRTDHLRTLLGL